MRVALAGVLTAVLLPTSGCIIMYPDPRDDVPDGPLAERDPSRAAPRRPTVTLSCAGIDRSLVVPILRRSGLFAKLRPAQARGSDMLLSVWLSTRFVGGAWRTVGLIPGIPLALCRRYTLGLSFGDLTGARLRQPIKVTREVEWVVWTPFLPLNLMLSVLPGDLGFDLGAFSERERALAAEMLREALALAAERSRFEAVPIPELIRMIAAGPRGGSAAEAAARLRAITRPRPAEVATLVAGLSHKKRPVREACQDALAASGPPVLPALVDALADPRAEVRRGAATTIGALHLGGDPLAWRPSMVTPSVDPRATARAVAGLSAALDDARPGVRRAAAYALALIGEPARPALPRLARAATDAEWDVARQAVYALGRLGHDAPDAIESLSDYLDPPTPELRKRLRALWDPAKNLALRGYVASALVAALSRGELRLPITARLVEEASGRKRPWPHGERLAQTTLALVARAGDADWRVRRAVVLALGELGDPRQDRARKTIRAAEHDPDPRVRRAAAQALERLSAPSRSRRF